MTFFVALFFVAVIALVLTGALVLLMWLEKKLPSKQYDARQQTVRGNAHKWALLIGFCYFLIIAMLECVLPSGIQADLLLIVVEVWNCRPLFCVFIVASTMRICR